jgi:8-oxo-dGTP pyrophosphatase MutT (NUDIX family)
MALNAVSLNETKSIEQACAVPFRERVDRVEFCLITSSAGRWKFPKGYIEPGETFVEAALKEALEEAGLHGRVVGDPIGYYEIQKKGQPRNVIALLMEVFQSDAVWEEDEVRQRRWVTPEEARDLVSEPELYELLEVAQSRVRAA